MLRRGSRGPSVRAWQQFLILKGHLPPNSDDGIFGPQTERATASFQRDSGFPTGQIDGIAGPLTLGAAHGDGFDGTAEEADLVRKTADGLGIDPDLMRAFVQVESGGRPGIRFEPHLAHRKLGDRAAEIPYTPQSRTKRWSLVRSETNRAAFDRALAMHEDEQWRRAIIESSSFGLFQVLGRHLIDMFGVDDAVSAYLQDEEIISHALLASWFRANPAALRIARSDDPNIEELVAHYNGRGPNVARYSAKLRSALAAIKARA
jgi:hypothetical protein